jgi:hypothetical protein
MTSGPPPLAPTSGLQRAGFWRRWLAIIIDTVIVLVPCQMLAAVLFSATAGHIQMQSGFYSFCQDGTNIPQELSPAPPHDSNFMRVCETSFFGAPTGAVLTVGRATREADKTTTVSQSYTLDKDGTPIEGTSIDLFANLALLAYLVVMIWKSGRSLGVPLGKATFRYLAMFIGAVPVLVLLGYQYVTKGGVADAMFTEGFFQIFIVTALIGALWVIALIIQIARKTDPVYDRLAGTAVVRN